MSEVNKAFVKDDDGHNADEEILPPRPSEPLPITARGLADFREEHAALSAKKDADPRRKKIVARILETVSVRERAREAGGAGFGCFVTVEHEDGTKRCYELVGPDESQPAIGRVSITSPLARALLRQKEGATVTLRKPQGEEDLTILAISCEEP